MAKKRLKSLHPSAPRPYTSTVRASRCLGKIPKTLCEISGKDGDWRRLESTMATTPADTLKFEIVASPKAGLAADEDHESSFIFNDDIQGKVSLVNSVAPCRPSCEEPLFGGSLAGSARDGANICGLRRRTALPSVWQPRSDLIDVRSPAGDSRIDHRQSDSRADRSAAEVEQGPLEVSVAPGKGAKMAPTLSPIFPSRLFSRNGPRRQGFATPRPTPARP